MYVKTCNVCHNPIEDNTPFYAFELDDRLHIHPDCLETLSPVELAGIMGLYQAQTIPIKTRQQIRNDFERAIKEPPVMIPLHRTQATFGITCSTCDGGGCPDCTDPA